MTEPEPLTIEDLERMNAAAGWAPPINPNDSHEAPVWRGPTTILKADADRLGWTRERYPNINVYDPEEN